MSVKVMVGCVTVRMKLGLNFPVVYGFLVTHFILTLHLDTE